MPITCPSNPPSILLDAGKSATLRSVPDGSVVCVNVGYYRYFSGVDNWPGSQLDQSQNACYIWRATEFVDGVNDRQFGWLLSEASDVLRPYSDDRKRSAIVIGESCLLPPPVEPPEETPETPLEPMPELPPGLSADCCEGLADALESIAGALQNLKQPCEQEAFDCSKITDECLDKIVDAVLARLEKPAKTCSECCDLIAQGISLSAEDAATCAECACDEARNVCSQFGLQPGERCPNCGQEPCCCTDQYTCEPCEEEPKEKRFIGWCNRVTGSIVVLREGVAPPQPVAQWQQASLSDDEQQALQQAVAYCQRREEPRPETPFPPLSVRGPADKCTVATFTNTASLNSVISNAVGNLTATAGEEIMRAGIDTLIDLIPGEGLLQTLVNGFKGVVYGPIASAGRLAGAFADAVGCGDSVFRKGFVGLSMLHLTGKYTGVNVEEFSQPIVYGLNAICRRKHLDPDKAIAAWLANAITPAELDTLWAMQGLCPEALRYYAEAARSKPLPNDLVTMRFRGLISESEYHEKMRQLGYTNNFDRVNLYERQKPLPTLTDIIRFMVRDADDLHIVQKFGLDDFFTGPNGKYRDQLRRWSEQQGIDETIAQYAWRSHWQIPSPTQLFDFWRRLRHKIGVDKLRQDIKDALVQQDILPYWHEAYLAVAHPPLTRVDVRRAFDIGEFTEQQVYDAHIDLGYSDDNARVLTQFAARLRFLGLLNHLFIRQWVSGKLSGAECAAKLKAFGYPDDLVARAMIEGSRNFDRSPEAKAFIRGEISADRLRAILLEDGVTPEVVATLLGNLSYQVTYRETLILYDAGTITFQDALQRLISFGVADARAITQLNEIDARIDAESSRRCQRAIRIRVRRGELTPDESVAAYVRVGVTPERAAKLAGWLSCEQIVTSKTIPLSKACDLMGQGAINGAEFVDRLGRLGYDEHDRNLLLFDCTARLQLRQQQQLRKQAQEQARDEMRARQAVEKASRQVQRQREQAEAARKKAASVKAGRQRQLLSAADKIIKKCGCTVAEAVEFATAARDNIRDEYALTIDESLQALLLAVEAWDGISFEYLSEIVRANAQLAVDRALLPSAGNSNGSAISGG